MKVAILGTRGIPSGYSGYEAFAEELGTRLVARGHAVTVYAHRNILPEGPPVYRGVRLVYLPSLKGKNTSQLSHSLLATFHVAASANDLVLFCNAANGPFGLILKVFGKSSAINVDGLEWMRPKWGGIAKRYFRFGAWAATRLFDVVVTDAAGMKDIYKLDFGCDSVDIAYGAECYVGQSPDMVARFGLSPGDYYLIASRLVPDNNADLIMRAFLRSSSKRKLAIAGGTAYRNPFEESLTAIADERVKFLGHIDDSIAVKELHSHAYGYIHGHQFGGTNPALLKALGCGNCVLALDTVFNREVLADGTYGILFPRNDEALSRIIESIDHDRSKRDAFASRAQDRIKERYTWEQITDQYESLFVRILSAKNR